MRIVAGIIFLAAFVSPVFGAEDEIVIDDSAVVVEEAPAEGAVKGPARAEMPPQVTLPAVVPEGAAKAESVEPAGKTEEKPKAAEEAKPEPEEIAEEKKGAETRPAADEEVEAEPAPLIEVIEEPGEAEETPVRAVDYGEMMNSRAFMDYLKAGIVDAREIEEVDNVETFVTSVLYPRLSATSRDEITIDGTFAKGQRFAVYAGNRTACGFEYLSMAVVTGKASDDQSAAVVSRAVAPVSPGDALVMMDTAWNEFETKRAEAGRTPRSAGDFVEGTVICLGEGRVMGTKPDDCLVIDKGASDGVMIGLRADAFSNDSEGESAWGVVVRTTEETCTVKIRKLYRPVLKGDPVEILGASGAAAAFSASE